MSVKTEYESEAYNSGWLDGYDALIVALYEGFNGELPKWLLSEIGGKKVVVEALKSQTPSKWKEGDEITLEPDYEVGETDGYEELLEEVEEAFKERNIELPTFLKEIAGEEHNVEMPTFLKEILGEAY